MSIVTKTGDKGKTGLFGTTRLPKDAPRIHAYGTVDELNANIGLVLAETDVPVLLRAQLQEVQHRLFLVGSDLSTPQHVKALAGRISTEHVEQVEAWIKTLEEQLPPLQYFIVPGGTRTIALLHVARTVCRRAEREVVTLQNTEPMNEQALIYLNRLSDYLFLAARKSAADSGKQETRVEYA